MYMLRREASGETTSADTLTLHFQPLGLWEMESVAEAAIDGTLPWQPELTNTGR